MATRTTEQSIRLLDAIKEMRVARGEILALRRRNVDLERAVFRRG
jgi:hypothetical protein